MDRFRLGAVVVLAAALGFVSQVREATAAAEVHRFNLVLSAIPTSIDGGDFNSLIDRYNQYPLGAKGLESFATIRSGWLFDAEVRYFARPNFAVCVGAGQMRKVTKREYLPAISQDINLSAEILTVPIHVGGAYYLAPYNQGDFQARAFFGGGLLSAVYNRARFAADEIGVDSVTTLGGTQRFELTGDSPGFYLEGGAHMFFAARWSVMISAMYRSLSVRNPQPAQDGGHVRQILVPDPRPGYEGKKLPLFETSGEPVTVRQLNLSGMGLRVALGIGF